MKTLKLWMQLTVAAALAAGAVAQNYDPADQGPARPRKPAGGNLLTDRLIDSTINRITDHMAELYGFDEDQLWNTRDTLKARFPQWLQQNRDELQALFVQYAEAVVGDDPPTPDDVADWAARALPLMQQFTGLVDESAEEMRGYLTDQQQVVLEGQRAAMQVATNYMQQRLSVWENGGYDWKTEWPGSRTFHEQERARQQQLEREARQARNVAMGLPADADAPPAAGGAAPSGKPDLQTRPAPGGPKDEWVVYTENFIKRYQLDEAQQNSAHKFLRDQQALRDRYLQRHVDEIKTLEEKQNAAKDEGAQALVKADYQRLYKPVEGYFERLKERLETLPRRNQRAAAAQADENVRVKEPAGAESKPAVKPDQLAEQTKP